MIHLNASTAKMDLIRNLEYESDKSENLYLIIDSLPTFLNTPIAFTVFNYQISRYPRKVLWWSNEPGILELLKNCTASIGNPASDKNIDLNKQNKIVAFKPLQPATIANHTTKFDTGTFETHNGQNSLENLNKIEEAKHVFSAENILHEHSYEPLDLIQDQSENQEAFSVQNFDSWIQKIEATKDALSALQNSQTGSYSPQKNNLRKNSKVFKILSLSLVLSLVFILGIILLPAKVYTIEVGAVNLEDGANLELGITDFNKSTVNFKAEDEIIPRGKKEVLTDLSTGEVTLINEGSRAVNLDNGLFKLVVDEKYYQVVADNTLPKSFSIPTKFESTKVLKFKIQAEASGEQYNLPINTKLDILNLQGAGRKVCSSCYAVTTSEIKNTQAGGQNIVTDYDQSFIVQSVESKIADQRSEAIKNLQKTKVFTNNQWYKNVNSEYNFSKALNEPADKLKLQASVTTDIFYLSQEKLEQILKEKNQNIVSFKDLAITDVENNPRTADSIKLKVFFTYSSQNTCLDKQNFLSALSSKEFDEAKKEILVQCPGVISIQKKDLGLSMPGIPSRVDLNVTNS